MKQRKEPKPVKEPGFTLLPGLRVAVGEEIYRIQLAYGRSTKDVLLLTPSDIPVQSKIWARIEKLLPDAETWVVASTGASYQSTTDTNQPNAVVCVFRGPGNTRPQACTPKDLAVLRAIELGGLGDPVFDKATRNALRACWFSRRKVQPVPAGVLIPGDPVGALA